MLLRETNKTETQEVSKNKKKIPIELEKCYLSDYYTHKNR